MKKNVRIKSRRERWAEVMTLAWPLILANGFWNLQLTIDRVFLGQFSTEALGAAMAVMGVFWVPMALVQQTAGYAMTFVAQYFGSGQNHKIGPAVWQAMYLGVAGGLLFLLLIPLATIGFEFINHAESVRVLEITYFKALCFSALPTAIVAAASGFFAGLGRSKIVMWINAAGLVANVLFDYLLIFGNWGFPALGIAGAGYATALANLVAASYALYIVLKKKHEREFRMRSGWRFDLDVMRRYLKYGVPSGLQWSLEGLAFTVFLIIIGRMENGSAALSASGIAVTVMLLAILPTIGVAQAVSVLVGQHLGNRKPAEAEESTWSGVQIAALYIFSLGLTFLMFPQFYLSWFYNPNDAALWAQVSTIVPYLLMFIALFTTFDSMNFVFSFALKGAGDTRYVTLLALTLPWPLMVLPTWLLRHQEGAIYWAWASASVFIIAQALVFWRRFVGGKWKLMSVIS